MRDFVTNVDQTLLLKGIQREANKIMARLDAYPDPIIECSTHTIQHLLNKLEQQLQTTTEGDELCLYTEKCTSLR